ncbi:carbohydrate porin [Aliisedimentitalea scapharcae]|uniref:Carbohydrate porin n=1 Tax=Aliisedimentitalea scapharcae TaxID=1524259 RepID=A0ABZ2XNW6_9RHOB
MDELLLMWRRIASTALVASFASTSVAQDSGARGRLEAAATASIGGPASAEAQQEQDRLRRQQTSRWPGFDRSIDPAESWKERLGKNTGLALSFDYQALYQSANSSVSGVDDGAAGQARILGTWTLADRGGTNPGSFVFILENRHRLGLDQTPAGLAGDIGYVGLTGLTFGDTGNSLSVAYWSQSIMGGRGGIVAGRIDPGDYTDVLGYVNPRTGFQNFAINYNPVLTIPDPGFGIGGGVYLTDQIYVLGVVSDANGSLTDVDWFPGGAEFYKYAQIGWTPARNQRYLTNVHLGAYHIDARADKGLPSSSGVVLSGNYTFENDLMVFGRLGWSDGNDPIAKRGASGGLIWRPGFYDDLIGIAATWAEPVTAGLDNQTTFEAFYRLDISDNLALTADVQYIKNPGLNSDDPLVFGLRLRFNL